MILTPNLTHVMIQSLGCEPINLATGFFVAQKFNIDIFHAVFLHGISERKRVCLLRWFRSLSLVPGDKTAFLLPKKGCETMLQQANGHVLPQNYGIEVERISVGQKNFTIMGQVPVIFFEDANGELQAMIKFDQHSPELLKREGLVFAHFALAEMVENEGLLVTV